MSKQTKATSAVASPAVPVVLVTVEHGKPVTTAERVAAAAVARGMLPVKQNTVIADVLARFITGERLTGMSAVTDSSTTRLADVVFRLGKHWGWHIKREDKAVGCRDGRMTYVSEYRLSDDQRAAALAAGAAEWCLEVQAARRALRAKAAKASAVAARVNARKRKGGK